MLTEVLAELHVRLRAVNEGELAGYIPPLAQVDPELFGLALVSMDGHRYAAGDADTPFTIQSVAKPFIYALAVADLGLDAVSAQVGTEPTGEAFNAISLEPGTGRAVNPMVNAGAIVTTSLVRAADPAERWARILHCLSGFAGRELSVDEEIYAAESATGDRNRALGYLLRSAGTLRLPVRDALAAYFRQCSVLVTAADLAVMAATLAAGGVNPVTGARIVPEPVAVATLAVMATCGMYDSAGDWLLRVGLPAKSGVGGGLIAVSPARFGVATFSPPLDAVGNPVRGVLALRELSERFGLHVLHNPAVTAPTVVLASSVAAQQSSFPRSAAELAVLRRDGERAGVVAAQGQLDFVGTERLLYAIGEVTPSDGLLVLDLDRVTGFDTAAHWALRAALHRLAERGVAVAVVGPAEVAVHESAQRFPTREAALRWAEDHLLAQGS